MKRNLYKEIVLIAILAITPFTFAQQKQSKTFTEKFSVDKNVEVAINATHAEIDVTTWNKNQVAVEATIEIEGLTKEEAEKYFKNWNFEALGNKNKVTVSARGSNTFQYGNKFVMFNNEANFPKVVIPKMPEITIPEIKDIDIPEVDFDMMFLDLENLEFDFDKYHKEGKNYFFQWKDSAKNITIKSKKDWEKFKNSKEYKKWKEEMKANTVKIKKELEKAKLEYKKVDKEKIRKAIEEARKSIKEIDMSALKKEMVEVQKRLKETKFDYFFDTNDDALVINGKKVKITKRISIKVPKGATFDLNTRHCKVKLPNSKVNGKVSYGSLDAQHIEGGDLKVYYSKVLISDLSGSTLQLTNVTDASIASVTNTQINTTSGDLHVDEVFNNVVITSSFGEVAIAKLNVNYSPFKLILKQSEGSVNLQGVGAKLIFDKNVSGNSFYGKPSITTQKNSTNATGNFEAKSADKSIVIVSKLSQLTVTN